LYRDLEVGLLVCLSNVNDHSCYYYYYYYDDDDDITRTDAATIIKLETEMFHDQSWIYLFWSPKVKVTSHENITGVGLCIPASAGLF